MRNFGNFGTILPEVVQLATFPAVEALIGRMTGEAEAIIAGRLSAMLAKGVAQAA